MTPRKKRSDSGRMRPTTIDEICDRFAALPAEGRDGLLLTLQQIDRAECMHSLHAACRYEDCACPCHDEGRDQLENPRLEEERCPTRE